MRLLLCVRDGPREPHEEGALLGPGQHLHQAGQQLPLQTVQLHQRPAHQHQVSSIRPLLVDYFRNDVTFDFRNHVDAKHGSGENKYVCEECNTEYKTLNSMRAHKSRVHMKRKKLEGTVSGLNKIQRSKVRKKGNKEQRLQDEILELELKTLPNIVRGNDLSKFLLT